MTTIPKSTLLLCCFVTAPLVASEGTAAASKHPAPGTRLVHFAEIDDGVYKGSAPRSDADFRFLQSKHIKNIVVLHFWPVLPGFEKRKARAYGITVIPIFLQASPLEPSETRVTRILALMRNKRYQPIYVHCTLGRDRTSLMAALYRLYFLGMPKSEAREYMDENGFKNPLLVGGLRRYLEHHLTIPPGLQ
jgi:protein tyrosine/serine phosphatase